MFKGGQSELFLKHPSRYSRKPKSQPRKSTSSLKKWEQGGLKAVDQVANEQNLSRAKASFVHHGATKSVGAHPNDKRYLLSTADKVPIKEFLKKSSKFKG